MHAAREGARRLVDGGAHPSHHVGGAGAGQPAHAQQHGLAFGTRDAQQAILGAFADGGDRRERDGAAVGADRDGDRAEIARVLRLARRHDGDERVGVVEAPDRLEHGGVANLLGHLRRREPERGGARRVEDDLHLAHVAAEHLDPSDAGNARDRRSHDQLGQIAKPSWSLRGR